MITQKQIDAIKRIIVESERPDKVVLFGSYARGENNENSDLDLLVIKNSSLPRYKRAKEIRLLLSKYIFQKDILFYTPEEVDSWSNVSNAFITTALREGKVLYEKN